MIHWCVEPKWALVQRELSQQFLRKEAWWKSFPTVFNFSLSHTFQNLLQIQIFTSNDSLGHAGVEEPSFSEESSRCKPYAFHTEDPRWNRGKTSVWNPCEPLFSLFRQYWVRWSDLIQGSSYSQNHMEKPFSHHPSYSTSFWCNRALSLWSFTLGLEPLVGIELVTWTMPSVASASAPPCSSS